MVEWDKVTSIMLEVQDMEKAVKGYSYEDKEKSMITDEKVCHIIIQNIRDAKNTIFHIIEVLYEMEKKEPVSRELQKLKDELDIFSDEVKARYCDWKDLDVEWASSLVKHDVDLLDGLEKLNENLQKMLERTIKGDTLTSGSAEQEKELWDYITIEMKGIEKQIDDLVKLFKQREGICNIKPISLEKTFEKIKERIERQI